MNIFFENTNENNDSAISNNKILIVDDDIFCIFSLKEMIKNLFDLECDEALNGH